MNRKMMGLIFICTPVFIIFFFSIVIFIRDKTPVPANHEEIRISLVNNSDYPVYINNLEYMCSANTEDETILFFSAPAFIDFGRCGFPGKYYFSVKIEPKSSLIVSRNVKRIEENGTVSQSPPADTTREALVYFSREQKELYSFEEYRNFVDKHAGTVQACISEHAVYFEIPVL